MPLSKLSISLRTISAMFVVLFFSLTSIYVFPSGGFQLVDIAIVLIILFAMVSVGGFEIPNSLLVLLALTAYMVWSVSNCLVYLLIRSDVFYLKVAAQNIFGATIFFGFVILAQRILSSVGGSLSILFGIFISLIPPFLIKGSYDADVDEVNIFGGRGGLSFNNPNQLGYYALMAYAMTILLWIHCSALKLTRRQKRFMIFAAVVSVVVCHGFVVYSAGRAAIGATFLLDLILMYRLRKFIFFSMLIVVPAFLIFLASPTGYKILNDNLSQVMIIKRFTDRSITADTAKRVQGNFTKDLPSELALIYGGGKTRHTLLRKEVHNGFLDIMASYGAIGFCLFLLFLSAVILTAANRLKLFSLVLHLWLLAPILLFNMFHNGFRFRFFWVFLAFWYLVTFHQNQPSAEHLERSAATGTVGTSSVSPVNASAGA
jgi:hypothetical protein